MPAQNPREEIDGAIKRVETIVEKGKPKLKRTLIKTEKNITNAETDSACRNARKNAHSLKADIKREISNNIRKDLKV